MAAVPSEIADQLAGKRFAVIGFAEEEGRSIAAALEDGQALARVVDESALPPDATTLRPFDMVIVNANPRSEDSAWLQPDNLKRNQKPLLLIGALNRLLRRALAVQSQRTDFLIAPWRPEEVVLRAFRTLAASQATPASAPREANAITTVAVADDDATTVALVKATLERHGFQCNVARDGAAVLELVRTSPPDALVLDVKMPHTDGFEVLAAMRSDPKTEHVPVLLLTALTDEADVVRGFGLGADDYVVKPFNPMELIARVARLLRRP